MSIMHLHNVYTLFKLDTFPPLLVVIHVLLNEIKKLMDKLKSWFSLHNVPVPQWGKRAKIETNNTVVRESTTLWRILWKYLGLTYISTTLLCVKNRSQIIIFFVQCLSFGTAWKKIVTMPILYENYPKVLEVQTVHTLKLNIWC